MSRYIDADAIEDKAKQYSLGYYEEDEWAVPFKEITSAPSIEIIRCKECKHRPIKEDAEGADYGFNISAPNGDERCPCLVEDGWYSWMPNDNFYCGFGERKESE